MTEYPTAKTGGYPRISPNFQNCVRCLKDVKDNNTIVSIWGENMLGYLSWDIICSSNFTVFLKLRSRKTVCFSGQIMSADKYTSIFSRQMETIVYLYMWIFCRSDIWGCMSLELLKMYQWCSLEGEPDVFVILEHRRGYLPTPSPPSVSTDYGRDGCLFLLSAWVLMARLPGFASQ